MLLTVHLAGACPTAALAKSSSNITPLSTFAVLPAAGLPVFPAGVSPIPAIVGALGIGGSPTIFRITLKSNSFSNLRENAALAGEVSGRRSSTVMTCGCHFGRFGS